jgi:SPP1 gp7 family putative phage head morphogenesis protein
VAGSQPQRAVHDLAPVDVPENEPVDQVPDLKTETMIAAIALLAGRLFRRRARVIAASYRDLKMSPGFGSITDLVESWARAQLTAVVQERQVEIVRPLVQRYGQLASQLERQIGKQLEAGGVVTPQGRPFTPISSGVAGVLATRRQAQMVDRSVKLIADQVQRKTAALLEQVEATVAQAALHNTAELPVIDFRPKIKTASSAIQRAAVDVTWTYQTAVQAVKYEEAGVQYATWATQADSRVRPTHKARHGRVYKISEGLEGSFPGAETACRCFPVPKRPGYRPR